jgi:hypothetical protein
MRTTSLTNANRRQIAPWRRFNLSIIKQQVTEHGSDNIARLGAQTSCRKVTYAMNVISTATGRL